MNENKIDAELSSLTSLVESLELTEEQSAAFDELFRIARDRARKLAERNAEFAELLDLGRHLSAVDDVAQMMSAAARSIKRVVPEVQSVVLFLSDRETLTDHLQVAFAESPFSDYLQNSSLHKDESLLRKAMAQKSEILVADTDLYDSRTPIGSEHCVAIVPIGAALKEESEGDKISSHVGPSGCLYVGSARSNAFSSQHLNFIVAVCQQLFLALQREHLQQRLQERMSLDELTGLYSHRHSRRGSPRR